METKELKIAIPEGQEIDWQESAKQEKIVFKKKDTKPRSWEEYCHTRLDSKETRFGFAIGGDCGIYPADWDDSLSCSAWRNVLPTKELAEAFIAMMQLMSLRQAWIEGWNSNLLGYAIMLDVKRDIMVSHDIYHRVLTFPDRNMAVDFMNTFKDLLETAKPLL